MPLPSFITGGNGGNPRTDKETVEEVEYRSDQIVDESLESTRRMFILCEESKEAGIRTLVALDDQGEQLDRIEEGMDQINSDMREADKHLGGMEKCCGVCNLPCGRTKEFREDSSTWTDNEDGRVINTQPRPVMDNRKGAGPKTGFIYKVTNDAREDEMEENMSNVTQMIGNLKNMAIDMGSEITSQNRQIDKINEKGESNEMRISNANERAVRILRS